MPRTTPRSLLADYGDLLSIAVNGTNASGG
jgi:hypothetical protein